MNLVEVLRALDAAIGGRRAYAIIGAVARNAWAPPRATTDLDLAVVADGVLLEKVGAALAALGYRRVREQRADAADALPDIEIFRRDDAELRQVDILVAKTPFEEDVLKRASLVPLASLQVPVCSPEDLIVYKLIADRRRDRDDIVAVLRTQDRAGRSIDWDYVERWARFWRIENRLRKLRSPSDD